MLFGGKKEVEGAEKVIKGGKTHTEILDENLIHAIAEVQTLQSFLHTNFQGSLEKVKYYADLGADLLQYDAEGKLNEDCGLLSGRTTPLRLATIRSNMDIVKYLVEEKKVKPRDDVRCDFRFILCE